MSGLSLFLLSPLSAVAFLLSPLSQAGAHAAFIGWLAAIALSEGRRGGDPVVESPPEAS